MYFVAAGMQVYQWCFAKKRSGGGRSLFKFSIFLEKC